jgi:hypothetical protein
MPIAAMESSLAKGQNLGMGRGVLGPFPLIGGLGNDLSRPIDNDRPHRHISSLTRRLRQGQGLQHKTTVAQVFGMV